MVVDMLMRREGHFDDSSSYFFTCCHQTITIDSRVKEFLTDEQNEEDYNDVVSFKFCPMCGREVQQHRRAPRRNYRDTSRNYPHLIIKLEVVYEMIDEVTGKKVIVNASPFGGQTHNTFKQAITSKRAHQLGFSREMRMEIEALQRSSLSEKQKAEEIAEIQKEINSRRYFIRRVEV